MLLCAEKSRNENDWSSIREKSVPLPLPLLQVNWIKNFLRKKGSNFFPPLLLFQFFRNSAPLKHFGHFFFFFFYFCRRSFFCLGLLRPRNEFRRILSRCRFRNRSRQKSCETEMKPVNHRKWNFEVASTGFHRKAPFPAKCDGLPKY